MGAKPSRRPTRQFRLKSRVYRCFGAAETNSFDERVPPRDNPDQPAMARDGTRRLPLWAQDPDHIRNPE